MKFQYWCSSEEKGPAHAIFLLIAVNFACSASKMFKLSQRTHQNHPD